MTSRTIGQPLRISAAAAAFAFAFASVGATSARAAETFEFDKGHTEIIFAYDHVGNSTQHGSFDDFDGEIVIDENDPTKSSAKVIIKAASVNTGVAALDDHLRAADFFEVEKYPEITFVSTSVKQIAKTQVEIVGDLTIKDNTKPVVLTATLNYKGEHPLSPYLEYYKGKHVAGLSATAQILRSEFGVGFAAPLTSDRVELTIETELFRKE